EPPRMPDATTEGTFEGTWYYVDPEFQIAIFISREGAGKLQIRYQLRDKGGTEYETDATGSAKYVQAGGLVKVLFTGSAASNDRTVGRHERKIHTKKGTVTESSDFDMFRAERGKKLVLHYDDWKVESTDTAGRKKTLESTKDLFRIFRKASEIVIGFEEIPF